MTTPCRALLFNGRESHEVGEFAVPDPPPGGALLRVEALGMCGSDLAQWHGLITLPGMRYPIVQEYDCVQPVRNTATTRRALSASGAARSRCPLGLRQHWRGRRAKGG